MKNQDVTKEELAKIRQLADFDLIMLISDIHDHDWPTARKTLGMMPAGRASPPDMTLWDTLREAMEPGGFLHDHPGIIKPKR